ncbi:uncharacterized protein LOC128553989 [Mercenaria mercenaria]|uniref:uncharacterized protein LOC128553989 n=1 Tax=Mercenaria mercenaria TaxID=6596 RepID=UPI00234F22C0|nr:uncharacterized protein LOC128553989 [Mercenaria mercenaria]
MFRKMAILDDKQEFQTLAENKMDEVRNTVLEKNKAYLQDICLKELQSMYDESIKPKITQGTYFASGGYKKYRDDFAKLREDVKQKLPTSDSIIIDMCVLEFEGRYRKQDEEILEKAEMTESQIKKGIQEQQAKLEQEMSELERKTELKRKEKEEELRIHKEALEAQRELEKQELQERYERMLNEWRKEKEDLERKIKENADSISKQQTETKQKRVRKPALRETVIKTFLNLIPVVGPIATGIYERLSSD